MDGDDDLRAGCERRTDGIGGDAEGRGVDVAEDRDGPSRGDRLGGGVEREGGHDDLIARPDAHRAQRDREGVGAVGDPDRVRRPTVRRELLLEGGDLGPEDVALGVEHPRHRRAQLLAQGGQRGRGVKQGDRHDRDPTGAYCAQGRYGAHPRGHTGAGRRERPSLGAGPSRRAGGRLPLAQPPDGRGEAVLDPDARLPAEQGAGLLHRGPPARDVHGGSEGRCSSSNASGSSPQAAHTSRAISATVSSREAETLKSSLSPARGAHRGDDPRRRCRPRA